MPESTCGEIKQLLERAIDETSDTEAKYKLRTASQLVDAVQQNHQELVATLDHAEFDNSDHNALLGDIKPEAESAE